VAVVSNECSRAEGCRATVRNVLLFQCGGAVAVDCRHCISFCPIPAGELLGPVMDFINPPDGIAAIISNIRSFIVATVHGVEFRLLTR
jgi:hypothetical protein